MADVPYKQLAIASATAMAIVTGVSLATNYKLYDPDMAFAAKCLNIFSSKFARLLFKFGSFASGIVLSMVLCDLVSAWHKSAPTDEADHNEAKANSTIDKALQPTAHPDAAIRTALKASGAQVARYPDNYGPHYERIRRLAIELRDSKRIIQNQTTALECSEHRADAAEHSLRAKIETIKSQSTAIELDNDRISDHKSVIILQAQHIRDTDRDLEAMAQRIEERDQRLWEAAGSLTVAEQEIAKLKAAVANKSTTSDYCCALDAIRRRDETIYALEKELAQQAKDSEFNQETVDTLATLLVSLGDKSPVQAVRELEAWAEEREARFDDFVTLSGPVVIAQQDTCQRLRETNDLQHKLLRNALKTRDRQGKTVAEVKAQLDALAAREEANIKVYNQTIGEKQHLLNALNNSQNSLQAAKTELHRRGTELSAVQLELSHHMLQQAIDGKKAKAASDADAAQKTKLATLANQVATLDKQLEAAEDMRVQEVAMMNNKVRMIREALQLTGLDCDLWTIESPEQLASMLDSNDQDQEARLAETCAELSAANDSLQTQLTTQTSQITTLKTQLTALKIELTTSAARHHAEFKSWRETLSKVTLELETTKRDSPSRDLENKVTALQLRLKLSQDDNAILADAKSLAESRVADLRLRLKLCQDESKVLADEKLDAEHKVRVLALHDADQAERLRVSRGCIDRCVKINNDLRDEVEGQSQQVKDLTSMLEDSRSAWRGEHEEMQRLTGLLACREGEVLALEDVREILEKKLLLGEEFVEVSEAEVPLAIEYLDEEEEVSVVQVDEKDGFADEFVAVDVNEQSADCFAGFEEVETIEGVDCFADDLEQMDADENEEGLS